jgi:hypothetical protein
MHLCSAAGAEESRIRHFSCDHVVPGSNLLPLVMAAGPSGIQLDFSYQHRGTTSTLGRIQVQGTAGTLGRIHPPPPPPTHGAGSNMLTLVMAAGPSGILLDFSFQHRGTTSTLGRTTLTCGTRL